jgi:post-segregation antitoxin (ccd killing protein)
LKRVPVEAPQNQLEQWRAENRKPVNAYNEHLDTNSVFNDAVRSF